MGSRTGYLTGFLFFGSPAAGAEAALDGHSPSSLILEPSGLAIILRSACAPELAT
jgi:hypothetical protein